MRSRSATPRRTTSSTAACPLVTSCAGERGFAVSHVLQGVLPPHHGLPAARQLRGGRCGALRQWGACGYPHSTPLPGRTDQRSMPGALMPAGARACVPGPFVQFIAQSMPFLLPGVARLLHKGVVWLLIALGQDWEARAIEHGVAAKVRAGRPPSVSCPLHPVGAEQPGPVRTA